MKTFTSKQRSKIYLEAAERIANYNGEAYVCNEISNIINGNRHGHIDESAWEELFLFMEMDNNAWLSAQITYFIPYRPENYEKYNDIKQTVLLLCAEMTKTENL